MALTPSPSLNGPQWGGATFQGQLGRTEGRKTWAKYTPILSASAQKWYLFLVHISHWPQKSNGLSWVQHGGKVKSFHSKRWRKKWDIRQTETHSTMLMEFWWGPQINSPSRPCSKDCPSVPHCTSYHYPMQARLLLYSRRVASSSLNS